MAYQPIPGGGVTVAATASSVAGTFPAAGASASMAYVANLGTVAVAVRMGKGAQVAVLTDHVIPGGQGIFLAKGQGVDGVAAIGLAAGPTNVAFSACDGNAY